MYTVNQAIGIRYGLNKRWEVIDLTAFTMAQLYQTFRVAQISLFLPENTIPVYLDIQDIAPTYATFTGKFSDLLAGLGNQALPTKTTGITLNHRKALFRDAFRAGYTVTPVNAVNAVDTSVPTNALPNVRLTRPDLTTDYNYVFKHCLVTVNGHYHRTDTDGVNGLMVTDAMKGLQISGQNQIGLLSFSGMCDLQIVPITPSMIDLTESGKPVFTLNQDMTNKSIILVFGGYMVFLDGTALQQVGVSSYKLNMLAINLVDRYYESLNYMDLTGLDIVPAAVNQNEIAIADLTTDATTLGWFSMSQTFAVVLNTPSLYTQRQYLARSGMPNIYFSYAQPNDSLVLELGRQPSYWSSFEDRQWRIALYDNVIGNELYYSNPLPTWVNTSGADMAGSPNHLSKAYFLEIGRDY